MPETAAMFARPAIPFGRTGRDHAYWLEAMAQGHVLHVLAKFDAGDVEHRLRGIAENNIQAVRPNGPGQWFIVGDSVLSPQALRDKAALLGEGLALSDQSHGRVRLAISGPRAWAALATGCSIDFSERAFPLGHSAATLYNHIGMHVARTGEDQFELIVLRSFAKSFWELLAGAADAIGRRRLDVRPDLRPHIV